MRHPFIADFYNKEDDDIACDKKIIIEMDDNKKFSIKDYRDALYNEMTKMKKENRKKLVPTLM